MDEVPSPRANAGIGSNSILISAGQCEDACALTRGRGRAEPRERHRIV
jgi:hypothetical protein